MALKNSLPKSWQIKKLREIVSFENGCWGSENTEKGVPILRSTNFNNDGSISFDNIAKRSLDQKDLRNKYLKEGDILLERSGGGPKQPVGRVVYFSRSEEKFYFGNFITRLRVQDVAFPKFLFYILYFYHQQGITDKLQNQTTGIRNLRFKEYLQLQIPLPPLSAQHRIVKKIDKLFEKIDQAKKLREETLAGTEKIIPSALDEIFVQKEEWGKNKLGKVITLETRRNENKKLPYIGMEDVKSVTGKLLIEPAVKEIKSSSFYFNRSHVLYGKLRPYLNKVFLPDFEGQCTTEFIPLKPDSDYLTREWLAHWLRFPETVAKIMQTVTGTRMPRANMDDLLEFDIPLPSLSDQRHIVKYLDSLQYQVNRLKQLQSETQKELDELKKSILDKAFKGELWIEKAKN